MAGIINKLGAEKVKHHLQVDIHYLRARLTESCQVYFEVKRGKHMKKDTQTMGYLTTVGQVTFDYPVAFDITMHKKGKKYVKKYFSIKLFEVKGNTKIENGRVKIDFSQIPVLKKPIIKREVILQHCIDKIAVVCISVTLDPVFALSKSSPSSSLVIPSHKPSVKPVENEKLTIAAKPEVKIEVVEEEKEAEVSIEETEDIEEKSDSDNESISSRMSFSDLIVHPRDSEVESESSSSEEEYKELSPDRLVAHSIPKVSKDYVTPNQNSKALQISKGEERAGIAPRREGGNCASCNAF